MYYYPLVIKNRGSVAQCLMSLRFSANISDDRSKNEQVAFALAKMDEARDAGLILLPETWNIGFFSFDLYSEQSETLDGPTMSAMAEKARKLNSYVYAGSFVEKNNGKLYNTAVLLDNSGISETTVKQCGAHEHKHETVCNLRHPFLG